MPKERFPLIYSQRAIENRSSEILATHPTLLSTEETGLANIGRRATRKLVLNTEKMEGIGNYEILKFQINIKKNLKMFYFIAAKIYTFYDQYRQCIGFYIKIFLHF